MKAFLAKLRPKIVYQTRPGVVTLDGKLKSYRNFVRFVSKALIFGLVTASHGWTFAQEENHLLDPHRESDIPIPLYRSIWAILEESWWITATISTLGLLVALGLWLRRHFRKGEAEEEEPPRRDPYEEAIEALGALDAKRQRMEAKPFTFRLSEILRLYVERRFDLPAMELTGEEFLREAAKHKFFRNHYDDLLREFIDRSDVVKYSRESMDGEGLHLLLNSATHFVKDTHRRLEEKSSMASSQTEEAAA